MIARVWRGRTRAGDADVYDRHYRLDVVAELRQLPGFRGARLLRRELAEETEFMSVVFFDDLDAIRRFAGDDYQRAVIADQARKVLTGFDEQVLHYAVSSEA